VLFQSQESSEPANEKRNQIAMKPAAQEKSITLPAVEISTDSVEIDPMLVISSAETEHPYRRPF
jgi:hypothetical protein